MEIKCLLAVTVLSVITGLLRGEDLIKSTCHSDLCYYLYKDEMKVNFAQAHQLCDSAGFRLASVTDQQQQDLISKIVHSQGEEFIAPWLAGRRSTDSTWKGLDGEIYNDVITYDSSTNYNCSAYTASEQDDDGLFYATPCKVPGPDTVVKLKLPVCQMSANQAGSCPPGTTYVINACYAIPRNWTYTAFDANSMCISMFPDSYLAHTNIADNRFKEYIQNDIIELRDANHMYPDVWLGIFRRPWVWLPDGISGRETIIKYSQWKWQLGTGQYGDCIILDVRHGHTWREAQCDESYYYFMCQTKYDKVAGGEQNGTSGESGESRAAGLTGLTIIIIACVAGGLFLIIVCVIVAAVLCKRSRNKQRSGGSPQMGDTPVRYQGSITKGTTTRDTNTHNANGHNEVSRGQSMTSIPDITNRELSPIDFNIMWTSVKDTKESSIGSASPPVPHKYEDYTNDGMTYENL